VIREYYIREYCLQYYAESHAVIYIVDSSDRDRIPDSKETFGKKHFVIPFDIKKLYYY